MKKRNSALGCKCQDREWCLCKTYCTRRACERFVKDPSARDWDRTEQGTQYLCVSCSWGATKLRFTFYRISLTCRCKVPFASQPVWIHCAPRPQDSEHWTPRIACRRARKVWANSCTNPIRSPKGRSETHKSEILRNWKPRQTKLVHLIRFWKTGWVSDQTFWSGRSGHCQHL